MGKQRKGGSRDERKGRPDREPRGKRGKPSDDKTGGHDASERESPRHDKKRPKEHPPLKTFGGESFHPPIPIVVRRTPPDEVREDCCVEEPVGEKTSNQLPLITVFGAGVSGLSAAHELVERGFSVQVVEPKQSDDLEYESEVGGMAANQFGRIKDTRVLHPYLFPEEEYEYLRACEQRREVIDDEALVPYQSDERVRELIRLRSLRMVPVQWRYGFPWRLLFERELYEHYAPKQSGPATDLPEDPEAWLDIADEHLEDHWTTNAEKLGSIVDQFVKAYTRYLADLEEEMRLAEKEYGERPVLSARMKRREILFIEIVGHTDDSREESGNIDLGRRWAEIVRDALVERLSQRHQTRPFYDPLDDPSHLASHFLVRSEGSRTPLPDAAYYRGGRRFLNRVELRVIEHLMPGDHGYRFFPAYYRHMFDLMKRTPILDRGRLETPHTAYDHLVVPPPVALALEDTDRLAKVGRHRVQSIEEIKRLLEVFLQDMKLQERDLNRFQTQLVKFLTSCPERRRTYEKLSWLHFADARKEWEGPTSDVEAKGYSKRAEQLLREVSQALIAMAAEETDALTHGNTSVQLLLDYLLPAPNATDMTLNGPTSLAWLRHWKRYLRRQGVRFFVGSLERFDWDDEKQALYPIVRSPDGDPVPWREEKGYYYRSHTSAVAPDFYVLAIPYERISDLVWEAHVRLRRDQEKRRIHRWPGFQGDFRKLMEFDIDAHRWTRDGQKLPLERDENGLPVERFRYPLRDLSGIQYFFANSVRLGEGHLVFPDAPWGLSSISQVSHWRSRPSTTHGFLGQLSVDLGDFYAPYDFEDLKPHRSAWNCVRQDIAEAVWKQTLEGLERGYAASIDRPTFYHLDRGIDFGVSEVRAPKATVQGSGAVVAIGRLPDGSRELRKGDVVGPEALLAKVALGGITYEVKTDADFWGVIDDIVEDKDLGVEQPESAVIAKIRGEYELQFPTHWTVVSVQKQTRENVNAGDHLLVIGACGSLQVVAPVNGKLIWIASPGSIVEAGKRVASVRDGYGDAHEVRAPAKARFKSDWKKKKRQKLTAGASLVEIETIPPQLGVAGPYHYELIAPLAGRLVKMLEDKERKIWLGPGHALGRIQTATAWTTVRLGDGRKSPALAALLKDCEGECAKGSAPPLDGRVSAWHACKGDRIRYEQDLVTVCYELPSPASGDLELENPECPSTCLRVRPGEKLGDVCVKFEAPASVPPGWLAYGAVEQGKWTGEDLPLVVFAEPVLSPTEGEIEEVLLKQGEALRSASAHQIAKFNSYLRAGLTGQLIWNKPLPPKVLPGAPLAIIHEVGGPRSMPVIAGIEGLLNVTASDSNVREGQLIGYIGGHLTRALPGALHRWYVADGQRVKKDERVAAIRRGAAAKSVRDGFLLRILKRSNETVVKDEVIGHLGTPIVIDETVPPGVLQWNKALPWNEDPPGLWSVKLTTEDDVATISTASPKQLRQGPGIVEVEALTLDQPIAVGGGQHVGYLRYVSTDPAQMPLDIKAPVEGVLSIWLHGVGEKLAAPTGQEVAVIDPTVVLSPVSGRVSWHSDPSCPGRSRAEGVDVQGPGQPLGSVCVPVYAPTLCPEVESVELTWKNKKHGDPVITGDLLAEVCVDVPSPASGKLEKVFRTPAEVVHACALLGCIGERTPSFNKSAFMINLPGQWQYRPGVGTHAPELPILRDRDVVTIADKEIVYTVSHDRYVMAGNFMGTLTRLSTMESANESARHAVNAILFKLASSVDSKKYNGAGRLLGDYVQVWNPERFELPDLDPLKRLDKQLFDQKVPHFIDVLRIPEIVEQMGLYEKVGDYPVRNLLKLLETAPHSFAKEWDFVPSAADRSSPVAVLDRSLKAVGGGKEIMDWLTKLVELCLRPPKRRGSTSEAGEE